MRMKTMTGTYVMLLVRLRQIFSSEHRRGCKALTIGAEWDVVFAVGTQIKTLTILR
jgi:hypothetical protein